MHPTPHKPLRESCHLVEVATTVVIDTVRITSWDRYSQGKKHRKSILRRVVQMSFFSIQSYVLRTSKQCFLSVIFLGLVIPGEIPTVTDYGESLRTACVVSLSALPRPA